MKNKLFTALWIGGEFNPVTYGCLRSFIDCGHRVQLFTYEHVENIPEEIIRRKGEEILPREILKDFGTRYANFSDLFRYAFLYKEGGFWIDTDIFCIREEVPDRPIYLAYETYDNSSLCGAALALPQGDRLAKILYNYAFDPGLVPPWEGEDAKQRLRISKTHYSLADRRNNYHGYTFLGPMLLTNAAKHCGYTKYARTCMDLFSIGWGAWRNIFFDNNLSYENANHINSWAIHCWGAMCIPECKDILENGKGPVSDMIRKYWKETKK